MAEIQQQTADAAQQDITADAAPQTEPTEQAEAGAQGKRLEITQDELDRLIARRLKRAESEWASRADAERKQAEMTEGEKLRAAAEAAEKRAADAAAAANARIVRAEMRVALAAAGVPAQKLDRAVRLVDLDSIEVLETGEPDPKAITDQVQALLKDMPELSGVFNRSAGSEFTGGNAGDPPITEELIDKMDTATLKRRMPEIDRFYKTRR
jgi:chemosensory pili system protein ChpA (sensor histidine kinase/response regulator)